MEIGAKYYPKETWWEWFKPVPSGVAPLHLLRDSTAFSTGTEEMYRYRGAPLRSFLCSEPNGTHKHALSSWTTPAVRPC